MWLVVEMMLFWEYFFFVLFIGYVLLKGEFGVSLIDNILLIIWSDGILYRNLIFVLIKEDKSFLSDFNCGLFLVCLIILCLLYNFVVFFKIFFYRISLKWILWKVVFLFEYEMNMRMLVFRIIILVKYWGKWIFYFYSIGVLLLLLFSFWMLLFGEIFF